MSQLHYALFTGCTAKQSTPELLSSTLAVADKLGIKITILEEASWNDHDAVIRDYLSGTLHEYISATT